MPLSITNSQNIAVLEAKFLADLCEGIFYIDITDSVYIGSGALNVLGANVKVVNPVGVTIKNYSTSGYDIEGGSAPMQDEVEVSIPTIAGNYQYGTYTLYVVLFDSDGTEYSLTKTLTISVPDKKNKSKKYGTVKATIKGLCKDGKAVIHVDTPPNYRGAIVETKSQEFTLTYPTGSELDPLETALSDFSVALYEGEYTINGEICALYNLGDNVYVKVKYKVCYEKKISCIIDECCILGHLENLHSRLQEDCSESEKAATSAIVIDALRLLKTAQLAAECNEDASEYIIALEELLGCSCTGGCSEGVPIINNSPSNDFLIEGCGVQKTTVGLTDTYTINNYEYAVSVNSNNVVVVGTPTLSNCKWTIPLIVKSITATPPLYVEVVGNALNISLDFDELCTWLNDHCIGVDCIVINSISAEVVPYSSGSGGEATITLNTTPVRTTGTWRYKLDGGSFVYVSTNPFTITGLAPGTRHVDVQSLDENGVACSSEEIEFTIEECVAPEITTQPENGLVFADNDPIILSVVATGTDLVYQWQYLSGSIWEDIAGETSATLNIPHTSDDYLQGNYQVIVSNDCGEETSDIVEVGVEEQELVEYDFFDEIPEDISAATYTKSIPFVLGSDPELPLTGMGINQHVIIRYPSTERAFDVWYNDPFNNGSDMVANGGDAIWLATQTISDKKYLQSRPEDGITLNTSFPLILS